MNAPVFVPVAQAGRFEPSVVFVDTDQKIVDADQRNIDTSSDAVATTSTDGRSTHSGLLTDSGLEARGPLRGDRLCPVAR